MLSLMLLMSQMTLKVRHLRLFVMQNLEKSLQEFVINIVKLHINDINAGIPNVVSGHSHYVSKASTETI